MKKFYKILEDFPASYDQTSDNSNNMRGLTPQTYRSPQVDEEEQCKPENLQMKDGLKKIAEFLKTKETLNKTEISKLTSMVEHILNKI